MRLRRPVSTWRRQKEKRPSLHGGTHARARRALAPCGTCACPKLHIPACLELVPAARSGGSPCASAGTHLGRLWLEQALHLRHLSRLAHRGAHGAREVPSQEVVARQGSNSRAQQSAAQHSTAQHRTAQVCAPAAEQRGPRACCSPAAAACATHGTGLLLGAGAERRVRARRERAGAARTQEPKKHTTTYTKTQKKILRQLRVCGRARDRAAGACAFFLPAPYHPRGALPARSPQQPA